MTIHILKNMGDFPYCGIPWKFITSEFSDPQCLRDTCFILFFGCEFLFYGECDDCGHLQKGEYPTYFLADLFVFLLQHQATIPKKPSDSNNHPGCSRKVLQQLIGWRSFSNADPLRTRGRPEHRGVSHDFLG
jgi:hypothetical protein